MLLVQFDHELMKKAKSEGGGKPGDETKSEAIKLLVDNIHSIPVRILQNFMCFAHLSRILDNESCTAATRNTILLVFISRLSVEEGPSSCVRFYKCSSTFFKYPELNTSSRIDQVKLYAEYATTRLIDFLRSSSSYDLEMAYKICQERDLVPEMVFLLGRMGDNKKALTLIIERLGDVHRAIEFAKEQGDDDLWEDLLRYSETRPGECLLWFSRPFTTYAS